MPRFPVNFRRKSTVTDDQNGPVEPSFRVLERNDMTAGRSFDGGARMVKAAVGTPRTTLQEIAMDDNLFVDTKNNRGSGSSNTTKAPSDNSSRHSNASTAPSSTDHAAQEDWRASTRKPLNESPLPPPPKSSGGGFLKSAGRTFSFGGSKKNLPTLPADEPVPAVPERFDPKTPGGRSRAPTASTITTTTPPQVEDRDFMLDLGGDLSNMLSAFSKRASVATVRDDSGRPVSTSRNLTGGRSNQPSPLHLDHMSAVEPPPKSWNSQRSDEGLLGLNRAVASPPPMGADVPPPVPRHATISPVGRTKTPEHDEGSKLLNDSLAATRFLSNENTSRGYRRDQDTISSLKESYAKPQRFDQKPEEDNMFDTSFSRARHAPRANNRANGQAQNKVMTPAEFEKYRQDKVRQSQSSPDNEDSENEDEDNYEDDEDEREKTQELAKQRRKQEAHMTVYRQQMMKVTGEQSNNVGTSRASFMSMSTPNLLAENGHGPGTSPSPLSDGSEDEEVPLAILAAHGFPSKNRPPTRLSTMGSNPNLRGLNQPSYVSTPGSVNGDAARISGGHLPAFARKLPQDPFLGAGLVNQPPRETFSLAGGAPAGPQSRPMPVGGLVGVIANEEKARAMRRGSPAIEHAKNGMPSGMQMPMGFDPMAQIPPQMMYAQQPMLTPGDQAQIQMTQQMQQFMQMQMQFMQMMTGQNPGQPQMQMPMQMPSQAPSRPVSHMPTHSMSSMPDARQSFLGDNMMMGMGNGMGLEPPRGADQMRTMSMVQPSSASWIQPVQSGYGAPSIRLQPGAGYAPSIAPSERSNIGLPGRYRPVSSINVVDGAGSRSHTMSGSLPTLSKLHAEIKATPLSNEDDDDDEQGWVAMKAQREKKKHSWRTKKDYGSEIGALIS